MDNKEIIFNRTLEEYNKKYKNRKYRLVKYTKKQVEDFDKQFGHYVFNKKTYNLEFDHYLLKGRKWWLIKDTYFEIPKPVRFTWFRNLNIGVQAATFLLGAGVIATCSSLPFILNQNKKEEQKEEKKQVTEEEWLESADKLTETFCNSKSRYSKNQVKELIYMNEKIDNLTLQYNGAIGKNNRSFQFNHEEGSAYFAGPLITSKTALEYYLMSEKDGGKFYITSDGIEYLCDTKVHSMYSELKINKYGYLVNKKVHYNSVLYETKLSLEGDPKVSDTHIIDITYPENLEPEITLRDRTPSSIDDKTTQFIVKAHIKTQHNMNVYFELFCYDIEIHSDSHSFSANDDIDYDFTFDLSTISTELPVIERFDLGCWTS